jgi:hypothetical protein
MASSISSSFFHSPINSFTQIQSARDNPMSRDVALLSDVRTSATLRSNDSSRLYWGLPTSVWASLWVAFRRLYASSTLAEVYSSFRSISSGKILSRGLLRSRKALMESRSSFQWANFSRVLSIRCRFQKGVHARYPYNILPIYTHVALGFGADLQGYLAVILMQESTTLQ